MNTPKSEALAAARMSSKCWTVLFSVTLAPTLSQFFPVGTEHVVLRIDDDDCGVVVVELHVEFLLGRARCLRKEL